MRKIYTLIAAFTISLSASAQIPNAGFESWTSMGSYSIPDGWGNMNGYTDAAGIYTCSKGTPGYTGNSYIKLISKSITGLGVVPGVAVNGILDTTNMQNIKAKSGFAYDGRPAQFTGYWQYMAMGSDKGSVMAMLTGWNSAANIRDTIAVAGAKLADMEMSWVAFALNFTYFKDAYPDSAIIYLSASDVSNPVDNSYLYADSLAFIGSVPTAISNVSGTTLSAKFYPNPANSYTNIILYCRQSSTISVTLFDMSGRNLRQERITTAVGKNIYPLSLTGLPKGVFNAVVNDGVNVINQKLIVE